VRFDRPQVAGTRWEQAVSERRRLSGRTHGSVRCGCLWPDTLNPLLLVGELVEIVPDAAFTCRQEFIILTPSRGITGSYRMVVFDVKRAVFYVRTTIKKFFFKVMPAYHMKKPSTKACPSGGMVDAGDSKSPAFTGVSVRVRPWAPFKSLSVLIYNDKIK
jgi:hypothetical protein